MEVILPVPLHAGQSSEVLMFTSGRIRCRVACNSPNFEIGKTDTLGLQLVVTLVEQLDASLDYKIDGGTDFLISFEKL